MTDNDKIVLDQIFRFPDAVKDVEYKDGEESEVWELLESEDVDDLYVDTYEDFAGGDSEPDVADDADGEIDTLYPPDWMEIVSQSVKTLPGGGQVVDVIIELPDLESDAIKYDVRVTK